MRSLESGSRKSEGGKLSKGTLFVAGALVGAGLEYARKRHIKRKEAKSAYSRFRLEEIKPVVGKFIDGDFNYNETEGSYGDEKNIVN